MLLMAFLAGRSVILAAELFTSPLPVQSTRTHAPLSANVLACICLLLIQSAGATSWLFRDGGAEAVLFVGAVLADGMATMLLALDIPTGTPGRRRYSQPFLSVRRVA